MSDKLEQIRAEIDKTDGELIKILSKRLQLVKEVGQIKSECGVPVYVPERESAMIAKRRADAEKEGVSPDLIEDILRRFTRESYSLEGAGFKCVNSNIKKVVIIGGRGGMGRIFTKLFRDSSYNVEVMGHRDWDRAPEIFKDAGLVIVSVPIDKTPEVIRKLDFLSPDCILADFTSTKSMPLKEMLAVHKGPVVGLHPMFGPDISSLAKQLVIWTNGREEDKSIWLYEQMKLWGAHIYKVSAEEHDNSMRYIQALRHFTTFSYGVFLANEKPNLDTLMALSSPIYRMELMMVGRLFAQEPSLYADIILSSVKNISVIEKYLKTVVEQIELLKKGDREGFIERFKLAKNYFGEYADTFLEDSREVLAKMHDSKII